MTGEENQSPQPGAKVPTLPQFDDGLRDLRLRVDQLVKRAADKPLLDFGEEFAPLTRSLAMISEPEPLLGLIVGGPKLGKTNLMLNLALGLIENTPRATVAFISAEVPRRALEARLICAHLARRRKRGEERGLPVTLADLCPRGHAVRSMVRERLHLSADLLEAKPGRLYIMHREEMRSGSIEPRPLHEALKALRQRRDTFGPLIIMLDYDAYLDVDPRSEGIARDELRIKTLRALANEHRALLITPHQARKGGNGTGWNGGGFEATKGSGEFVYAADFVMHLRGKARQAVMEDDSVIIRADLMNRHGSGDGFYLEALHAQALMRAHPDQKEAEKRWEGAGPKKEIDPDVVLQLVATIERAVKEAGGSISGGLRLLGLEVTNANRKAIRVAIGQRHISAPLYQQMMEAGENHQTSLPL